MKNKSAQLFLTFLRIGAFTFGGGYAMIPLIQAEVCDKQQWLTEKEILEIITIAESTPGPLAINAATFTGYRTAGLRGAFAATSGVLLPSFLIIILISFVMEQFMECKLVQYAFLGIRIGILALILKALYSMFSVCEKNIFSYCIIGLSCFLMMFVRIKAIWLIVGCAAVGLIYTTLLCNKEEKK